MSNYNSLKATINANIKTNGNQEITGSVLNSVLIAMVDTLGAGYMYAGIAAPSINPGTPDAKVFYIAATPGTYTNFGGLSVASGEVVILKWNSSWSKEQVGVASKVSLDDLDNYVRGNSSRSYNKNILTIGGFIRTDGTATAPITTYNRSEYISVSPGDEVSVLATCPTSSVLIIAGYGSEDESDFVGGVPGRAGFNQTYTYVVPANVHYIRLSGNNEYNESYSYDVTITAPQQSLTERMTSMESSIQGKQNLLVSGVNIKTIDGESILGGGNLSTKIANFKYLFVENGIIVARPSGNRMITIRLGAGGGNGLFDFREIGTLPLGSEIIEANIQRLHFSSSDWIAPFQIKAVNNIDGDDLDNITFTGGSHQYNNQITGSTPTARLASVEYRIDGEVKTTGGGMGNILKIVATEYIQGTNTKKADGTGREILKEIVTWSYDGDKWDMETELVPLEDIQMIRWYGYQFTGISNGALFDHWGYINGASRLIDAVTSGNDKTIGMYAFGNCNLKMLVDPITDMGNRAFMTSGATDSAFKSGSKGYFFIANNNAILGQNNHYFLNGSYEIGLPKGDILVKSGSFHTSGTTINSSFPVSDLENGTYYVVWHASGSVTPNICNIYRSEMDKSGLIQPLYTDIAPGQKCYIDKTAETNYLWFFRGGLSSEIDATITYEVYQPA